MLEEIECPSELIEVDDDTAFPPLNTSLVLEKSRIGVERLPIVDDDLSTPLVEYPRYDNSHQHRHSHNQEIFSDLYQGYQTAIEVPSVHSAEMSRTPLAHHPELLPYEVRLPEQ
ncbi:unnamed protein product [Gongylonema pulchrum]|uniref:Uncharacterized protein n=1 Tax=Gongylonema pulchrum TaxID=637853 RepID=A0A3P7NRJ1_9BILA|nr:unnamed protein product [Gongylonema pulchrum]